MPKHRTAQIDILVRIIQQDGCQGVSCAGIAGAWNSGLKCPFREGPWCNAKGGSVAAAKSLLIVILWCTN